MTDEAWLDPKLKPSDDEVAIDYIKSHNFGVIWADGALGSLTPNGMVHFVLYAERAAIPRRQVFRIEKISDHTGTLGDEIVEKQISRGSIVREMACDVFLSVQSAENLARWLLDRVEEAKGGGK